MRASVERDCRPMGECVENKESAGTPMRETTERDRWERVIGRVEPGLSARPTFLASNGFFIIDNQVFFLKDNSQVTAQLTDNAYDYSLY